MVMKENISQLMDGELEESDAARALSALRDEGEGRQVWRTYHLIGDALRDTRMLSQGFSDRVAARLLQRVAGIGVVRCGPAGGQAGQQHAGVLAGAVHQHRARPTAVAQDRDPGRVGQWQVGRAAQVGLAQSMTVQQGTYPFHMKRFGVVARRDQRQIGRIR